MYQYSHIELVPTPKEREIFSRLRHQLAPDANTRAGRKLFLSRRSITRQSAGKYRALQNEDEVVAAAEALGFEICEPELLSIPDQIKLFSEAEIVVGLGGAALFNVMFCKTRHPGYLHREQHGPRPRPLNANSRIPLPIRPRLGILIFVRNLNHFWNPLMTPKLFHFVTGLREDFGGKPFVFAHYMAIRSALDVNPGFSANVYFSHEPTGQYWDLIRPHVKCIKVDAPKEIFGNSLYHFAHQADVLRLQILLREGGVYMDMDTICQRPFEPLLGPKVVMGIESIFKGIQNWRNGMKLGLCNALIIAPENAEFLRIWYENYKSFDASDWNAHSVHLPGRLARENPDLINVEPPESFFWPICVGDGLASLFEQDNTFPEAYSIHLWESLSWQYLSLLNFRSVVEVDSSYNRIARKFVSRDIKALEAIARDQEERGRDIERAE
jgi:hypothetical protein